MPDQPAPKSLHQQTVDYTVQAVGNLHATIAARDLTILDLRHQLAAAHTRIAELEAPAVAPGAAPTPKGPRRARR